MKTNILLLMLILCKNYVTRNKVKLGWTYGVPAFKTFMKLKTKKVFGKKIKLHLPVVKRRNVRLVLYALIGDLKQSLKNLGQKIINAVKRAAKKVGISKLILSFKISVKKFFVFLALELKKENIFDDLKKIVKLKIEKVKEEWR